MFLQDELVDKSLSSRPQIGAYGAALLAGVGARAWSDVVMPDG